MNKLLSNHWVQFILQLLCISFLIVVALIYSEQLRNSVGLPTKPHSCVLSSSDSTSIATCSVAPDSVLLQDLEEYSKMMLWKYPHLANYNNPYGICEEGNTVKFSSVDKAKECAIRLISLTPYPQDEYASIKDYFYDVFDVCLPNYISPAFSL